MRALCWAGVHRLQVETVADPAILNPTDVIVRVRRSAACGSDLHLLDGGVPTVRTGDVLGHEFLGEVVEVGREVRKHRVGDRVVVASFLGCGSCWFCRRGEFSLCDNSNPDPGFMDLLWGASIGGCFGFAHATGGFAGGHAEYVRVPFADVGAFTVPEGVDDDRAVFAGDAAPTGWMGADLGGVAPGDVVAVWGAGAVGQMAARAANLLGAERVVVIDSEPYRLEQARGFADVETIDNRDTAVLAELEELTGGRGPDVCIEAVGMEATRNRIDGVVDRVTQAVRLQTGRPTAVREAVLAARKGGSVFVLGVFVGAVNTFPLGPLMNKGLTLRGAQQHGQRYIPMLLERMAAGELRTERFATHVVPLEDGPHVYDLFREKLDGCVRPVLVP